MKIYLECSVDGDIVEVKTKDKLLEVTNYEYEFIEPIYYHKYNFVLLYNNKEDQKENITKLPFTEKKINGKFLLFLADSNNNIKSLSENKLLALINIQKNDNDNDYSSDDFNLSD